MRDRQTCYSFVSFVFIALGSEQLSVNPFHTHATTKQGQRKGMIYLTQRALEYKNKKMKAVVHHLYI